MLRGSPAAQVIIVAAVVAVGAMIYARQTWISDRGRPIANAGPATQTFSAAPPDIGATTRPLPQPTQLEAPPNPRAIADDAIAKAQAQVEQSPQAPASHVALAMVHLRKFAQSGDTACLAQADAACAAARRLDPDHYGAISLQPHIWNLQHRFPEAILLARRAIGRNPKDPFNYGSLGDALLEMGEYEEAVTVINQMARLRPDSRSYARVAQLHELYGDVEGAIETMRQAVYATVGASLDQQAWAHTRMGNLYFNAGRLDEAEAEFAAALEASGNDAWALSSTARLRAARGKFEEAVALYRRSLSARPRQETAMLLGRLLLHLGRSQEAGQVIALMESIEEAMHQDNIGHGHGLAMYWADLDTKLPEALHEAEHAAIERFDIRTMDSLAWALYKNGRFQEALDASDEAVRLGTRDALLHFHRGMILLKLGRKEQAAASLRLALEINPYFDIDHAAEIKAELAKLATAP